MHFIAKRGHRPLDLLPRSLDTRANLGGIPGRLCHRASRSDLHGERLAALPGAPLVRNGAAAVASEPTAALSRSSSSRLSLKICCSPRARRVPVAVSAAPPARLISATAPNEAQRGEGRATATATMQRIPPVSSTG